MNFQVVEQANGQNVDMIGTITEFIGEGINQKSGKPWKKCKIRDEKGVLHNVTLRGTLPTVALINQKASFQLASFKGIYQNNPYTGYSGFWNDRMQIDPNANYSYAQQPARNMPQASPQPQQATNSPQGVQNTPQDKDSSICRQTAGKVVGQILSTHGFDNGKDLVTTVLELAIPLAKWFETGIVPVGRVDEPKTHSIMEEPDDLPPGFGEEQQRQPGEDDVPFEQQYNLR